MPRNLKYWQRRFGNLANLDPYYQHLDLRRIDDLDDEGFAFLINPVKGVDMLDLNETEITNASIRRLCSLEYLKELRVKGCKIDDGCIADLDKLRYLELLHVKNTNVTIDGLLHLTSLANLKTVFFSAPDVDGIKEKLLQLKAIHPVCEFVIDGKTYYFDDMERFIYAAKSKPYSYKLKVRNQELIAGWSNWIVKQSNSYYETEKQGPHPTNEIEWIDIDPIEEKKNGELITVNLDDHTEEIEKTLQELTLPYLLTDGIIRVYIL